MIATPRIKLPLLAGLPLACLLLAVSACKREAPQAPGSDAASAAISADADAPAAQADSVDSEQSAATSAAQVFKTSELPVSDVALGAFPYIGLPERYRANNVERMEYERVPFWTGDRLEWVEGKVYSTMVDTDYGQSYSALELSRNVQHVVESLGGKRIHAGKMPDTAAEEIRSALAASNYERGIGDISTFPVETYVIHRADRDIWLHLCAGTHSAGLLIAESQPFQASAKALPADPADTLPADALKQALTTAGKVAIQVNFATDAAQILPDSEPQLEQVITLLREDAQLKLAVEGHTDNSGSAAHNQPLSQARAEAVVQRLKNAGIAADRLAAQGFGQTRPVADNATEEGRARNRRVELVKR